MTERSYPFDGDDTTDVEFSTMFRQVFPASVVDGLQVTADSSGLNVKVGTGMGYVRGHTYQSDAIEQLTIDAGGAQPRIDVVILRLEYGSVNDIHLEVKKGTPAASPAAPTLEQTDDDVYEFALANVLVPASAVTIAAGNVTDRRIMWLDAFKAMLDFSLAWSAITGKPSTFPPAAHTHSADDVTSGTFDADRIPDLPASKITSGQLENTRLPTTITRSISTTGSGRFGAAWNNNVSSSTRRVVWMTSNGTLGHTDSSRRYKKDIEPWEGLAPEVFAALRVVTFRWRDEVDPSDHIEWGMIAEELAELGLDWAVFLDEQDRPQGIHYDRVVLAVIPQVQRLADQVAALSQQVADLTARLGGEDPPLVGAFV